MRRQSRAEPKRPYLVAADALVPKPQLDHVREQPWNRSGLDDLHLSRHELRQRLAVDPVLHLSSLRLIYINSGGTRRRARARRRSPTGPVHLRLDALRVTCQRPRQASVRSRRAHRSTLLQRHTEDRPSLPSGFGNPGPLASTFTRCGEIPRRFAMSTAMTSSVRESTCTQQTYRRCCVESTPLKNRACWASPLGTNEWTRRGPFVRSARARRDTDWDAQDARDRELLARGAIDELLAGYVDLVRARCRNRCGAHGDDVAQQACLRLWRELSDGKHREGQAIQGDRERRRCIRVQGLGGNHARP